MMRLAHSLLRQRRNRGFQKGNYDRIEKSSSVVDDGEGKTETENPNDSVVVEVGIGEGNGGTESPNDIALVFVGGERVGEEAIGVGMEMVLVGERDRPPADDVCPICFGDFTVPCKTDCGHWFCGNCFMELWSYKASLQRCKCPICSRLVSKLTPEACLSNRQEREVIEILKDVHRYNRLVQGGVCGFLQNVLVSWPLVIKIMLQRLMDPARFHDNISDARCLGCLLWLLYLISPFDFIPGGVYRAQGFLEACFTGPVLLLCLVGLCRKAYLHWRVRPVRPPTDLLLMDGRDLEE